MDALLNLVEKGNEFLMSYFLVAVLFGHRNLLYHPAPVYPGETI